MILNTQKYRTFFYKYWWLYYILFFLLLGLLIYAVMFRGNLNEVNSRITLLNNRFDECCTRVIVPIEKINESINCDDVVNSGGQGNTETQHELGTKSGKVVIEYDMKTIPDEINVFYDNKLVTSSQGLVSGNGSLVWEYKAQKGKPTFCIVQMTAPQNNTEWKYVLGCPK